LLITKGGEWKIMKNYLVKNNNKIMSTWMLLCVPNITDISSWIENNISFITNIIFYTTFFIILNALKKNFALLIKINNKWPENQNNLLFNKILNYFSLLYYFILVLVIISFILDSISIFDGRLLVRDPLDYSRLFKLLIVVILFTVNIIIKKIKDEVFTIWDCIRFLLLFLPILFQCFLAYGSSFSLIVNMLFMNFANYLVEIIEKSLEGCFINRDLLKLNIGGSSENLEEFYPYKKRILLGKNKMNNILAMNNDSGRSSETSSISENYSNPVASTSAAPVRDNASTASREPSEDLKRDIKGKGKEVVSRKTEIDIIEKEKEITRLKVEDAIKRRRDRGIGPNSWEDGDMLFPITELGPDGKTLKPKWSVRPRDGTPSYRIDRPWDTLRPRTAPINKNPSINQGNTQIARPSTAPEDPRIKSSILKKILERLHFKANKKE